MTFFPIQQTIHDIIVILCQKKHGYHKADQKRAELEHRPQYIWRFCQHIRHKIRAKPLQAVFQPADNTSFQGRCVCPNYILSQLAQAMDKHLQLRFQVQR